MTSPPILPPSIDSVAKLWADAWALPAFEIAPSDFDERLLTRFDDPGVLQNVDVASMSSGFILDLALRLALRGEMTWRLHHLCSRAASRARPVADALASATKEYPEQGVDAPFRLLIAGCVEAPELPSAELIADCVRCMSDALPRSGSRLHAVSETMLRLAAFGALLAQDADLLDEILRRVPAATLRESPQWNLNRRILAVAEPVDRPWGRGFEVPDHEVRDGFMKQFALHRAPVPHPAPGAERMIDSPLASNYLHCWAWLSLFSPDPVRSTNWATMRELMTG